jgi:ABC-type Zn uptake system ZnuABC Zn-binding protein ZnuA
MHKHFYTLTFCFLAFITPKHVLSAEIAVTLPPLAGLVAMLDDQTDVLCLLPAGADPHHFQLQPRTIESLQQSRLLIRASFDDGGWPLPARHTNTLDLWPDMDHGWLSPTAVRKALPRIADALSSLYPERTDDIALRLKQALVQTFFIESDWQTALMPVKQSGVIMQHPAWQRLMNDRNIPVLAVLESGRHGHQHGPHLLEDALEKLKKHPDAWLVSDIGHSQRALDWLAQHAKPAPHRIALDALGQCGVSWVELMQANLNRVRP